MAEQELLELDEAYLEARRAEIDVARRIAAPGPSATEEERVVYARLPEYIQEATEALQRLEETLRQRRVEESKRRQQAVQWEVVRLRLRRTMGRQVEDRRRQSAALVSRVLPSDRGLTRGMGDGDWSEQRRYLSHAVENFRNGMRILPPEEILGESRVLLEFFSLLQQPRPQEAASEHRLHLQLAEAARDLRTMMANVERQLAMTTLAERAMNAEVPAGDEN